MNKKKKRIIVVISWVLILIAIFISMGSNNEKEDGKFYLKPKKEESFIIASNWVKFHTKITDENLFFPYKKTDYNVVNNDIGGIYKIKVESYFNEKNQFGYIKKHDWIVIMWYLGGDVFNMGSWIPVSVEVDKKVLYQKNIDLLNIKEIIRKKEIELKKK